MKRFRIFSTSDSSVKELVSTHHCIESTIQMVQGLYSNGGIRFKYVCGDEDFLVNGSSGGLQQVLMILFVNAKDAIAGRPNALISVNRQLQGKNLLLEVCDNGPGIAAENCPRIFEPFFTTKPSGKGTGLGLAIAHRLITEMNGTLELASTNEAGSAFRISLPLSETTKITL